MFEAFIVKPIFNLLTFIYAVLPGHNFGLAIILFTVLVRLLMWPLLKKQLHHAKAMKALAPEIKRIKKEAKGNKQLQSTMTMALYKEKEINPFASIGILVLQLPILLALYAGLNRIIKNPEAIVTSSYPFIQHLGWMKELAGDISKFSVTNNLFGLVDLSKPALSTGGSVYFGAMIIAVASSVVQYFQSAQLMPSTKDAKSLRTILRGAKEGEAADQEDVSAAVGKASKYFLPVMLMFVAVRLAAALPLYWTASGLVAYIQQARVLGKDEEELEDVLDGPAPKSKSSADRLRKAVEAEVVTSSKKPVKKEVPKIFKNKPTKGSSSGTTVVIRGPGAKKS